MELKTDLHLIPAYYDILKINSMIFKQLLSFFYLRADARQSAHIIFRSPTMKTEKTFTYRSKHIEFIFK